MLSWPIPSQVLLEKLGNEQPWKEQTSAEIFKDGLNMSETFYHGYLDSMYNDSLYIQLRISNYQPVPKPDVSASPAPVLPSLNHPSVMIK